MPRTHATVAISLHPELREDARQRAQQLGFGNSFSAYVAKLIAEDIRSADVLRAAPRQCEQATASAPVSYRPAKAKRPKQNRPSKLPEE